MSAIFYILSIVGANVITAAFKPFSMGWLLIPYGTILIGLTFVFRDWTQERYGRLKTYLFILLAFLASGVTSYILGDGMQIITASLLAFALSETTDTEIYTRLKLPIRARVIYSGIVAGALDSATFVIIGLSPIGVGWLTWDMVPGAIAGQVIVKGVMQFIAAGFMKRK